MKAPSVWLRWAARTGPFDPYLGVARVRGGSQRDPGRHVRLGRPFARRRPATRRAAPGRGGALPSVRGGRARVRPPESQERDPGVTSAPPAGTGGGARRSARLRRGPRTDGQRSGVGRCPSARVGNAGGRALLDQGPSTGPSGPPPGRGGRRSGSPPRVRRSASASATPFTAAASNSLHPKSARFRPDAARVGAMRGAWLPHSTYCQSPPWMRSLPKKSPSMMRRAGCRRSWRRVRRDWRR